MQQAFDIIQENQKKTGEAMMLVIDRMDVLEKRLDKLEKEAERW